MSPAESPAGDPNAPAASQTKTVTHGLVGKVILSAGLGAVIFLGLALYSDLPKLRAAAMDFNPSAFGVGLVLVVLNYALRAARWQYYLRKLDVHVPIFESSLVFLSGFVMSVTPGKVGEVFKSLLLLESRKVSFVRTAPVVIAERLTDLIALVLLTAVGALTFPQGVALASVGAVAVGALVLIASHRRLGEWLLAVCDRLPLIGRISSRLREAHESLLSLTRPGTMLVATLVSIVAWAMECGTMYFVVRGFEGVTMELDAAIFSYAASTIVGALAMMPGGLGVTEVGMTGLVLSLGGPGMTAAVASATTILVRVATLWFAVLVGAIALGMHRAWFSKPHA